MEEKTSETVRGKGSPSVLSTLMVISIPKIDKIYLVDLYDSRGVRPKGQKVRLFTRGENFVISFDWPVEYYLCGKFGLLNSYPFRKSLCIDISGRRNNGYPLYVSISSMNLLFEEIFQDYPVIWSIHQKMIGKEK